MSLGCSLSVSLERGESLSEDVGGSERRGKLLLEAMGSDGKTAGLQPRELDISVRSTESILREKKSNTFAPLCLEEYSAGMWKFSCPPSRTTKCKRRRVSYWSEDRICGEFPDFATACDRFVAELKTDVLPFLLTAYFSYSETVPKRQRFIVYRHLAVVAGWKTRTRFPKDLEKAIQTTWEEEREEHTGFVP